MSTIIIAMMLSILSSTNCHTVLYFDNQYICCEVADANSDVQDIVDDHDLAALYHYGTYRTTVIADHSNQLFKNLKNVKKGDIIYTVDGEYIKQYKCVKIKVLKMDKDGHIRTKNGKYMGDEYKGRYIILQTCKNKTERYITYWKSI